MTLEEAIKHNETIAKDLNFRGFEAQAHAVRLGREALEKIKAVREGKAWVGIDPLPGETEE